MLCRAQRRRLRTTPLTPSRIPTRDQTSAGGIAVRRTEAGWEAAITLVASRSKPRWQLPKGLVDPGETPEIAAVREVREEAGVDAEILAPIEVVEYWYYGTEAGGRVRYHKRVHFFLLEYRSGDVADHDREVMQARWVSLPEATEMLAFDSERRVAERAREMLERAAPAT